MEDQGVEEKGHEERKTNTRRNRQNHVDLDYELTACAGSGQGLLSGVAGQV